MSLLRIVVAALALVGLGGCGSSEPDPNGQDNRPVRVTTSPELTIIDFPVADATSVYFIASKLQADSGRSGVYRVDASGADAQPTLLFELPLGSTHFLVGETHVYFIDQRSLYRVPKAGGPPERVNTFEGGSWHSALGGKYVYFQGFESPNSVIYRSTRDAPGPRELVRSTQRYIFDMMANGTHLYWFEQDSGGNARNYLLRVPISEAAATPELVLEWPNEPARRLYSSLRPRPLVTPNGIYLRLGGGDGSTPENLARLPLAPGGGELTFIEEGFSLSGLAADGQHLYYCSRGSSSGYKKLPFAGGAAQDHSLGGQSSGAQLAVNESSLFYTSAQYLYRTAR